MAQFYWEANQLAQALPQSSIFNATATSLIPFRSIRAKCQAGAYGTIIYAGTSLDAGFGLTPGATDWPAIMQNRLATNYGNMPKLSEWIPGFSFTTDGRVVYGAGWANTPGIPGITINGNAGTFTPLGACVAFNVFYLNNGVGTATITINGVGHPITPTNAGTIGTLTVAGLPSAIYAVSCVGTGGANATIVGIEAVPAGATGLRSANLSISGSNSSTYWGGNATFKTYWQNIVAGLSVASPNDTVVMIGLQGNDATQGVSVAQSLANMQFMANAVLAAGAYPFFKIDNDYGPNTQQGIPWYQNMFALAQQYNAPLLNTYDYFGSAASLANTYGFMQGDLTHPTVNGTIALANLGATLFTL